MTDITDQDQKDYAKVNRVLEQMQGYVDNESFYTGNPREWLRDLREVFPAPAPTLAEELRELGSLLEEEGGAGAKSTVWARDLAARVGKIEQENQEQREWNLAVNEQAGILTRERNEARAEVERLTAFTSVSDDGTVTRYAKGGLIDKAAHEELDRINDMQKGAESTAESTNPSTVEALIPTLAEDLREIDDRRLTLPDIWGRLRDLADRAEQIERHNDEVVGIVEDLTEQRDEARKERDHFFREVENVRTWKEQLLNERDEARAEIVRGREIIRKHKEKTDRATGERDEALAEVERLTVQKGAESTAESTNPADVPAGQPWLVQDNDTTTHDSGSTFVAIAYDEPGTPTRWRTWDAIDQPVKLDDTDIKLFARLVPAPRTITTVEELDALPHDTIIMAGDTAYQRGDESHAFLADWWHPAGDIHSETSTEVLSHATATVLH